MTLAQRSTECWRFSQCQEELLESRRILNIGRLTVLYPERQTVVPGGATDVESHRRADRR